MGVKVRDKSTGAIVEVDSKDAQNGLQQGRYESPGRVQLVRNNEIGEVDADRLSDSLSHGWRVADPDEQARTKLRAEETDLGSTLQGGAEAGIRGLSLGTSDPALVALGADPKRLRARKEGLGATGTVIEVAGAVAPALLTSGGSTAAGGALRTAASLTPAGAAARLGTAAAGSVRGAGGLARGVAALAVEGGVEGVLQGAGEAVSHATLTESPLTAEQVVAGAGRNAGLGMILGGGMGIAGAGLSRAAAQTSSVGKMLRRGPDPGIVEGMQGAIVSDEVRRKVAKVWAKTSGNDEGAIYRGLGHLKTEKGAAMMLGDIDAVRQKTATSIKTSIDKSNDAWDDLIRQTGGDARTGNAERLMTGAENAVAPDRAMTFLRAERSRVDDMLADELLTAEMRRDLKQIGRQNEVAQRTVRERGTGAESFRAVDRYKQDVAHLARSRGDEFARSAKLETGDAAKQARSFDEGARGHLYDESIYGAAAVAHRESNQAWAQAISAADDLRRKSPALGKLFKRGADAADIDTTLRLAKMHTRASGGSKTEAFSEAVEARVRAVKKLREHHDLAPDVRAKIDEFEGSVKAMKRDLVEQGEHAAVADDMWKMRQNATNKSPSQTIFSTAGPAAGALVGSMFGGPAGAAAGMLLGHVMDPGRVLRVAAQLRGVSAKVGLDTSAAVSRFASLAEGAHKATAGARATARTGARHASSTARSSARSAADTKLAKKQRNTSLVSTMRRVATYAGDPAALGDDLRDDELWHVAPRVGQQALATSTRAVQFLHSVAPVSYKPTFGGGAELFDPIEMSAYARYLEAVTAPLETAAKLGEGTMTVEHATAIRTVFPQIYAEIQDGIMSVIGKMQAAGQPVDFKARTQLGVLGDVAADDSLKPQSLARIYQSHGAVAQAEAQQEAAQGSGNLRKADTTRESVGTEQGRLAMGGESS